MAGAAAPGAPPRDRAPRPPETLLPPGAPSRAWRHWQSRREYPSERPVTVTPSVVLSHSSSALLHDLKIGHHRGVLMLEIVAVHDVPASVALEAHDHPDFLALRDQDGVLPTGLVWRRPDPVAVENLEVDQVDVD